MFRYSRTLITSFSKTITPYIIVGLFVIVYSIITSFIIVDNNHMNGNPESYFSTQSIVKSVIPFVFGSLFSLLVVIYIFNGDNELAIISKPLKRNEILFGKFMTLVFMLFIFQLIVLFNYFFVSLADSKSTFSKKVLYSVSGSFGGLIVQLIFVPVIVFLSMILKKMTLSIIITSFVVAAPTMSLVLITTTGGKPGEFQTQLWGQYYSLTFDQNGNWVMSPEKFSAQIEWYNDVNEDGYISKEEAETHILDEEYVLYREKSNYQVPSYFDMWYQWGRFYDIFNDINKYNPNATQKWRTERVTVDLDDNDTIEYGIGNGERERRIETFCFVQDSFDDLLPHSEVAKFANDPLIVAAANSWTEDTSVSERYGDIGFNIDKIIDKDPYNHPQPGVSGLENWDVLVYQKIMNDNPNIPIPLSYNPLSSYPKDSNGNPIISSPHFGNNSRYIASHTENGIWVNNEYTMLVRSEWIETWSILLFWILFGVFLNALTVYMYYRRDYK